MISQAGTNIEYEKRTTHVMFSPPFTTHPQPILPTTSLRRAPGRAW
jgi:hypothetical protein